MVVVLYVICFAVALFACTLGALSGMGGGIIIKPVLDATGVMSVATVTFLSGCTVILMTGWTLGKTLVKKESVLDVKNTTYLAVSAAIGGLMGKQLFSLVASLFVNPNKAGGVQALLLLVATIASFVYTLEKDRIAPKQVSSRMVMILIGFFLGILGSFLGIGGGPFNVAILYYFFSMPTKKATQNSLYIVLFSQLASTCKTVVFDGIPPFSAAILIGMIVFGITGSEIGRAINRKINEKQATRLFELAMILVMSVSVYNIIKFF